MTKQKGIFIISLDFELYWGIRDLLSLEDYKKNLLGVWAVVPALLKLFNEYKIQVTWATVGLMFFENRNELIKGLPKSKPEYKNKKLSPYNHLNSIGLNEKEDPYHYALSLIELINSTPYQEIGTHTFSHYYCLEDGQNIDAFKDDLKAAVKIAKKYNITFESIVFPRNQFNKVYLSVLQEMGIKSYRVNSPSWIYRVRKHEEESLLRRGIRLLDSYCNISGYNCYSLEKIKQKYPFSIPLSRYLRPHSNKLKIFESLRLYRILSELTFAAKNGLVYHLDWHPHNFGINLDENTSFLAKILDHYLKLKEAYGMESLNMKNLSNRLLKESNKLYA